MLNTLPKINPMTGKQAQSNWERAVMRFVDESEETITPVLPEPESQPTKEYVSIQIDRDKLECLRDTLLLLLTHTEPRNGYRAYRTYVNYYYEEYAALNDLYEAIQEKTCVTN